MKKYKTRFLVFMLLLTLTSSLLAGCGSDKKAGSKAKMDRDHVYKAEYIDVPEGITNISRMVSSGDYIYFDAYNEKKNYQYEIYRIKTDGSDLKCIVEQKPSTDEGVYRNIAAFSINSQGNLFILENLSSYKYDEKTGESESSALNSLVELDADGKEINRSELNKDDSFYVHEMICDKDDNVIFAYSGEKPGVIAYNKAGKQIAKIDAENANMDTVFATDDGKVLVSGYTSDYSSKFVKEIDLAGKKLGEEVDLGKSISNIYNYSFFTGNGYDLFLKDSNNIYGFNLGDETKTQLLNFIDSDVNGNAVSTFTGIKDGKIAFVSNDYVKNTVQIGIMEKVKPEDVVEKEILTLAAVYVDMNVSNAVIEFNKKDEKYRITIKDYSEYNTEDDYNAGQKKMNTDIISGIVPDILCLSGGGDLPNYVSKGLIQDLNEMMETDKEFNKSDYLENIFKAFENDGKLYELVPYFNVFSIAGKTSNVGDATGWTIDEAKEMLAKKPEGTKLFDESITKQSILDYGNYFCMSQFIDWSKATCDFDNDAFKKLLAFANEFPAESKSDAAAGGVTVEYATSEAEESDSQFRSDKTMLQVVYLYSYEQFHELQKATFMGDVNFIGFPNEARNGNAIASGLGLSIFSKSAYKDVAWKFVKGFLSDDYQKAYLNYGWPVKLSALEEKKKEEQKPDTYTDENGKEVVYENTIMVGGNEVKIGKVTDEECEKVLTFLKSLTQVMRYDTEIYNIITEESGAYFAGQKSVDETAKIIQNRIQTYISENQ